MPEMTEGIEIEFNKQDNDYFENQWNNNIDANILVIALLETINDICKENNLNTNEQLEKYMNMGSIDNYNTEDEKRLKEEYKTF